MKPIAAIACTFVAAAAAFVPMLACSSRTPEAPSDGGVDASVTLDAARLDASVDSAPSVLDAAPEAAKPAEKGVLCPNAVCTNGELCCASDQGAGLTLSCQPLCGKPTLPLECDGPEDCAGTKVCCTTLATATGSPPRCPVSGVNSSCLDSCVTDIQLRCPAVSTVRPCHASSDCPGTDGATACCEFTDAGTPVRFCVPQTFTAAAARCF